MTSGNHGGSEEQVTAEMIGRIEIFRDLAQDERSEIAALCRLASFNRGEVIISGEGDDHDVYFMIEGAAEVLNHTLVGNDLTIGAVNEGAYFGELSALDNGPRSATVRATGPCLVAAMEPTDFRRILSQHQSVLVMVLHNLAQMIRRANLTVLQHATL